MANALVDVYDTYATFHTAVEAIDDTKVLAAFTYRENGTGKTKFVVVRKT